MKSSISTLPKFNGEPVFARLEGTAIMVSAENGDGIADYWHSQGPWIHPRLEAWAEKRGLYWEWQNPGAIVVHRS